MRFSLNRHINYTKIYVLLAVIFSATAIAQKNPNFVVIVADDQGWSHTSVQMDTANIFSKSDFIKTPNLEKLVKQGMRFSRGYAASPVCAPSRLAIQTGLSPARLQYTSIIGSYTEDVEYNKNTIAHLLKKINKNYKTAHFGKWHIEAIPKSFGYDVSDGNTDNAYGSFYIKDKKKKWSGITNKDPKRIFSLTKRANSFITEQAAQNTPFFVQISHYANHDHLMARSETLEKFKKAKKGNIHKNAMYAAMSADLDEGVGLILENLQKLGILNNTYIIYTSDNGGVPKLPPTRKVYHQSLNYPLKGGKWDLTEGGIRVPLLVSGPNIAANSQTNVPVVGYDFLPTILELAGKSNKQLHNVDGKSFAPILLNQQQNIVRKNNIIFHYPHYNFFGIGEPHSAIIDEDFKLVKMLMSGKTHLFNIKNNESETIDIKVQNEAKAKSLEKVLDDYLKKITAEPKEYSKTWHRGKYKETKKFFPDSTSNKNLLNPKVDAIIHLKKSNTNIQQKALGFYSQTINSKKLDSSFKNLKPKLVVKNLNIFKDSIELQNLKQFKEDYTTLQLNIAIDLENDDSKAHQKLLEKKISLVYNQLKKNGLSKHIQWGLFDAGNALINKHRLNKVNTKRYLNLYRTVFSKIKSVDKNAIIVAPIIKTYHLSFLTEFLTFAKKHHILPSQISWQEVSEHQYPLQIQGHTDKILRTLQKLNIPEIPIQINNYVSPKRQHHITHQIFYITNLEKSNIKFAVRDVLSQTNTNIDDSTLKIYDFYSEMEGSLLNLERTSDQILFDGLATLNHKAKKIQLLLARTGNMFGKKLQLEIDDILEIPWLANKEKISITIHHIVNSNKRNTNTETFTINKKKLDDFIRFHIPNFRKQEGVYIEIE